MTDTLVERYGMGVDPGKVNLGVAVVKAAGVLESGMPDLTLSSCATFNPSSYPSMEASARGILEFAEAAGFEMKRHPLTLERYAAYQGVVTSESENITSLIGIFRGIYYLSRDAPAGLYRAIDWKIKLVQLLNSKYGFKNPSNSLDKKFSLAAAKFIITTNKDLIKNDHEADATCLAAMPFLFPGG